MSSTTIPDPGSALSAVVRPLHTEVAGGVALLVAAVGAVVWANSPWRDA